MTAGVITAVDVTNTVCWDLVCIFLTRSVPPAPLIPFYLTQSH